MGTTRFQVAVSLEGYVAGPRQSERSPLGEGGTRLHEWVLPLEAWRREQGQPELEQVRVVDAPGVTHIRYRVVG